MLARMALVVRIAACCVAFLANAAWGLDFRIETKVFADDPEQPVSESTTLFHAGLVYDFAGDPAEVAVFRLPVEQEPGRFVLVNADRTLQTELTTDRIDQLIAKLNGWAMRSGDAALQFAAAPQFDRQYDETSGTVTLASHTVTYRADTVPLDRPEAATMLASYWDWYAKLNCILSSPNPPGPRLELNRELASRALVPVEIGLTRGDADEPQLRSVHTVAWRLSNDDLDKIADVNEALVELPQVTNAAYLQARRPAEPAK